MCSISGIIQLTKSKQGSEDLRSVVTRMNLALRHRGPDDCDVVDLTPSAGTHSSQSQLHLCLGNTRLAILDTSKAGHQPMLDPETGNWITYNGETYNYRELRSEIGNQYGPWRSSSDTEVVLRAYRKWGLQAFAKLRGMFALAIWDEQRRELILARDRFGIKPLYCFWGNDSNAGFSAKPNVSQSISSGRFVFASEVRALLASDLVPRKISSAAVSSFLEYGSVQAPLTMVENVWSLMPGCCLRISENSQSELEFVVSAYRTGPTPSKIPEVSRDRAKSELRNLLEDSVKQHLVSDVPLGVFLSGGMDSSAIVGLMSQVAKARPQTFSVIFDEATFTEAEHSRSVAEIFGTEHHEIKLSEQRLLDVLPNAIKALDQPTMDGINTYVVSQAVKAAGITVALSGLGGDELFGGYPSFRRALRLSSTGIATRGMFRSAAAFARGVGNGSARTSKFVQLAATKGEPSDVYRISRQLFSPESIQNLCIVTSTATPPQKPNGLNGQTDPSDPSDPSDPINAISQFELNGYMANTLLRDTDSMSMAHSLEVRVPFVDTEVADYVLSLPGSWKVGPDLGKTSKPLLAETISDLFPREFFTRAKMGFTLPFEKWMTQELRPEISSILDDGQQLAVAGIAQLPALDLWKRFLRKPKATGWSRPWSIYVLAKWCQANDVEMTGINRF